MKISDHTTRIRIAYFLLLVLATLAGTALIKAIENGFEFEALKLTFTDGLISIVIGFASVTGFRKIKLKIQASPIAKTSSIGLTIISMKTKE